jgi:hypothetical protein
MNGKNENKKLGRIVRFTGWGALLMATIGLILFSPLSASGQDVRRGRGIDEAGGAGGHPYGAPGAGPHRFASDPDEHIAFLEIVLDLSADQVKEIEPILAEHHEKIAGLRGEGRKQGRHHDMRMKRMHRSGRCDKVDRTEMRAKIRRQRRELEQDREKMRASMERSRDELDKKLSKVLDDGQMEKYRKLRVLREDRREHRQELREERREGREDGRGRRGNRA